MTASGPYRLSPYCVAHVDPSGRTVHLVHGRIGSRFELPFALWARVLAQLAAQSDGAEAASTSDDVRAVMAELVTERILVGPDVEADTGLFRDRLTPIELAFHAGLDEGGYDADRVDTTRIPDAVKPPHGREAIALPDDRVAQRAPSSWPEVRSRRRARRAYAAGSLSLDLLSTWLSATLRTRRLAAVRGLGTVSRRSYPSAGGRHPLEGYLVVRDVETVLPGIYHYHPLTHTLQALPSEAPHRDALFAVAVERMGFRTAVPPQVLLVLTAVFARTCWKYRGMPYHAILLETGALYQAAMLEATVLDLAVCPVGAYPERAIGEILGLDRRDEAAIGLLALGLPDEELALRQATACVAVNPSPFGSSPSRSAAEFTLDDGTRETVPLADLRWREADDGSILVDMDSASEPVRIGGALRKAFLDLVGRTPD